MTPRSKRYFARKSTDSMFVKLMPIFDGMMLVMDALEKLKRPRPTYSSGTPHSGGPAIVGEVGPELVKMEDGRLVMTDSRIRRMELPANSWIIPRQGLFLPDEFYDPETKGVHVYGSPEKPVLINFNPPLSSEQLKDPAEDMTRAFNRQIINSIIKQASR